MLFALCTTSATIPLTLVHETPQDKTLILATDIFAFLVPLPFPSMSTQRKLFPDLDFAEFMFS